MTIELPPLRERTEDIPLLAEHFVRKAILSEAEAPQFSDEALTVLQTYEWPGNIRELENAVLRAVSLCDDIIYPEHLPSRTQAAASSGTEKIWPTDDENSITVCRNGTWMSLAELEHKYVCQVLDHFGGNKQAASRVLNIDRKTLARMTNRKPAGA